MPFVKYPALFVLISLLSACSLFDRDASCADGQCKEDPVSNAQSKFYCYGNAERLWECEFNADDSKIVTVIPEGAAPLPAIAARSATTSTNDQRTRTSAQIQLVEARDSEAQASALQRIQTPLVNESISEAEGEVVVSESDWSAALLAFPDSSYTVQLIAMRQLDNVLAYADQVNMSRPLYSRVNTEGQICYVLLLGIYPDFETAETARTQWIGTRVLKVEPWVRKLAPLQEAILAAQSET